jgi:hypothetical protein
MSIPDEEFWTTQSRSRLPNSCIEHRGTYYLAGRETSFNSKSLRWRFKQDDKWYLVDDKYFTNPQVPGDITQLPSALRQQFLREQLPPVLTGTDVVDVKGKAKAPESLPSASAETSKEGNTDPKPSQSSTFNLPSTSFIPSAPRSCQVWFLPQIWGNQDRNRS